jgi:hypothetical protein
MSTGGSSREIKEGLFWRTHQVGESGWTAALPLEGGGAGAEGTPGDDFSAKPVLVRARVREWGTLHEVVARLELVGSGFERTLVRVACFGNILH